MSPSIRIDATEHTVGDRDCWCLPEEDASAVRPAVHECGGFLHRAWITEYSNDQQDYDEFYSFACDRCDFRESER